MNNLNPSGDMRRAVAEVATLVDELSAFEDRLNEHMECLCREEHLPDEMLSTLADNVYRSLSASRQSRHLGSRVKNWFTVFGEYEGADEVISVLKSVLGDLEEVERQILVIASVMEAI